MKLSDSSIVDLAQAVGSRASETAGVMGVGRGYGQRVLAVLEDQSDYVVDRIDSLVDFVGPQDLTVGFVPPLVIDLHLLLGRLARPVLPFIVALSAFFRRAGVAAQDLRLRVPAAALVMLRGERGGSRGLGREGPVRLLLALLPEVWLVLERATASARLVLKRTTVRYELIDRPFTPAPGCGFIHDLARQALGVEQCSAIHCKCLDQRCF